MTHQILLKMFEKVNLNSELEVVAWTSVLVGFSMILRVSNLGPRTRKDFEQKRHLLHSNLQVLEGFWSIGIRWSKTVQTMNKVNWAPLVPSELREICPRNCVLKMIKYIPVRENEPLFLVREGKQQFPLTSRQVGRLLKKRSKAAGLEGQWTGHCLRRGGLNWAHKAKLTGEALKILGDWGSQAYMRYIDLDFESRLESSAQMVKVAKKWVK